MTFFRAIITFMETAVAAAKACRNRLGLSQGQFAERFGLHPDTYKQWERGRRKPDQAGATYLRLIAGAPATIALHLSTPPLASK
jgi:putative transcriptional regulator